MIELTRLNGSPLAVNCDLIKYVESSPDTTLTLVTGEKIVVRESCAIVSARVLAYRALLLRETGIALNQFVDPIADGIADQSASIHAAAQSATSAHTVTSLPRMEDKEGSC